MWHGPLTDNELDEEEDDVDDKEDHDPCRAVHGEMHVVGGLSVSSSMSSVVRKPRFKRL